MSYCKISKELRSIARDLVSVNTADQQYKQNVKDVLKLFVDIKKEVSRYNKEQQQDKENWGHAGSMGHVKGELGDIYDFLKRG